MDWKPKPGQIQHLAAQNRNSSLGWADTKQQPRVAGWGSQGKLLKAIKIHQCPPGWAQFYLITAVYFRCHTPEGVSSFIKSLLLHHWLK